VYNRRAAGLGIAPAVVVAAIPIATKLANAVASLFGGGPSDYTLQHENLLRAVGQGNVLAYLTIKIKGNIASPAETAFVRANYEEIRPLLVGNDADGPLLLDPTTEPHRHDVAVQAIAAIDASPEGQQLKAYAAALVSGDTGALLTAGGGAGKWILFAGVGLILYSLLRR